MAENIYGVQPAALDQPQIYGLLRDANGNLLKAEFGFSETTFTIRAFLDTGASSVLIGNATAEVLSTLLGDTALISPGVPVQPGVEFRDVGVGGTATFAVTTPLTIQLAPYRADVLVDDETDLSAYSTTFTDIYAQVGPLRGVPEAPMSQLEQELLDSLGVGNLLDLLIDQLDVFGMPVMRGQYVHMDARALNQVAQNYTLNLDLGGDLEDFLDMLEDLESSVGNLDINIRTSLHDYNTTPRSALPEADRRVKLSYGDFAGYTETIGGGTPPTLEHNPFIGTAPGSDEEAPQIQLTLTGLDAEGNDVVRTAAGSFLLDTGAASSIISEHLAATLGVRYSTSSPDTRLELFDPLTGETIRLLTNDEQFTLTIAGIGGQETVAGFFLDSLLIPTIEGTTAGDDSLHLNYIAAPVLVYDIKLSEDLTLDGILGMNYLVASTMFDAATLSFFNTIEGPFDHIIFNEPDGLLELTFTPEPAAGLLLICGAVALAARRRRVA